VNRHGERSPDADELSLSDQQEKIKNLTWIEGLEGLTNGRSAPKEWREWSGVRESGKATSSRDDAKDESLGAAGNKRTLEPHTKDLSPAVDVN
ncbi:jg1488, partial [Pararge aegeria aegeria]